jgi:hypothetical protein
MMSPGDVIWYFFLFSALQPVMKQHFLDASRQRLIARIQKMRGSRVILLVHRQAGPSTGNHEFPRFSGLAIH